jgi:UDP-N-acetylmuramoylalanine--D-glutamate ligase
MACGGSEMWNLSGKRILVIGAARSGLAAAKYLQQKRAGVTLTDAKPREKLNREVLNLETEGIRLMLGADPEIMPMSYDYAVISPGVPLSIPLVKKIKEAGIPLLGELELAFRESVDPYIAITGTNGKTTTTALTGQIFLDAGRPVFVGGNIGTPLVTGMENLTPNHIVVAEVSSFQLETIDSFRPKVAVLLNITPDHLDRHGDMAGYTKAKARIFENQRDSDFAVLNRDDPRIYKLASQTSGKVIFFSTKTVLERGVCVRQGQVAVNLNGNWINILDPKDIYIKGRHNLENALAATATACCLGIPPESIAQTLKSFPGVAHRLEYVTEIDGVTYINDSKGTNPDSTIKALEAYSRPIVLIAGGRNKGSDFTQLAKIIKNKVRTLILVGEAAPAIRKAVENEGFNSFVETTDFAKAVGLAQEKALPGDIVMLSPACASWDMFNNFEERGDLFKILVTAMK